MKRFFDGGKDIFIKSDEILSDDCLKLDRRELAVYNTKLDQFI